MLKHKTVHLHTNRLNRGRNILLLLVPSIIFAAILLIFFYRLRNNAQQEQVAIEAIQESNVLGGEAELDNPSQRLSE